MSDNLHTICNECITDLGLRTRESVRWHRAICSHCLREVYVCDIVDLEMPGDDNVKGGMKTVCAMVLAAVVAFVGLVVFCTGCSTTDRARIDREIERAADQINGKPNAPDAPDEPSAPLPPPPVVDVPLPVDPPPVQPEGTLHIVKRMGRWYGPNLSSASTDDRFILTVSRDGRDWSAAPSDWRSGAAGAGCPSDCNVMVCAAYQRPDGSWVGGKYDWNRPKPSPRSYENIAAGYNGWQAPAPGTEIIVWCYTADGNRVSREARAVYK